MRVRFVRSWVQRRKAQQTKQRREVRREQVAAQGDAARPQGKAPAHHSWDGVVAAWRNDHDGRLAQTAAQQREARHVFLHSPEASVAPGDGDNHVILNKDSLVVIVDNVCIGSVEYNVSPLSRPHASP